MSATPAASRHIPAVDGLRGLAIGLVLLFHFWQQTWTQLHLPLPGFTLNLNILAETGFIGVQLFFVLSGFCIAWPYSTGRPLHARDFLRRRAAKILPSYLLCLLVIVLFFLPEHLQNSWPRHLLMNLLFLQVWSPEYLYHSFNPVLWSLALEIHFYLLFAALGRYWMARAGTALVLSLLLWLLVGLWALGGPAELFDLYRHQLWGQLPYFAAGVYLAVNQPRLSTLRHPGLLGLLGMSLWIGVAYALWVVRYDPPLLAGTLWPSALEYLYTPVLAAGFSLTLLAVLQGGFWSRLFSLSWLSGLGLISYNLYIWHQFLIVRLKIAGIPPTRDLPFGQDPQWQAAMWATALSLALGLSWFLTRYFEEPLRLAILNKSMSTHRLARRMRQAAEDWMWRVSRTWPAQSHAPMPPPRLLRDLPATLYPHRWPLLALSLSWVMLCGWLQINALQIRADGIWAGHLNIWSDWPLHIAMAIGFAERSPALWFEHHPLFAGGGLNYPFLVNLVSGLLLRLGLSLDWAISLPTFVASALTPYLLWAVFFLALRKAWQALAGVCIFYLGAGLAGFEYLWQALQQADWQALAYPSTELSRHDRYDWYSGNFLTGMLLPQRAFVFGFPLALLSLILLSLGLRARGAQAYRYALTGGVLAGLMPIIHTHSYMALALFGVATALIQPQRWRIWSSYGAVAAALGLGLAWIFLQPAAGMDRHMVWAPGFTAPEGLWSWVLMWWQLWGLFFVALALGLSRWRQFNPQMLGLGLGALLCFGFANLVMIQPNRWDNSKIFLWAYLGWTPICVLALSRLRHLPRIGMPACALLAIGLVLTGLLEIQRLLRVDKGSYMISTQAEYELALQVREHTPADAVFLTATAHNHPVMAWAGRPILLGFTGWMANLGFDPVPRERALRQIFLGAAQAASLLDRHGIDYVYIGPAERVAFAADANWFKARYPLAFARRGVQIFGVSQRAQRALSVGQSPRNEPETTTAAGNPSAAVVRQP